MLKKVAFTMFPVKDSDRARAFYEGVFGLKRGSSSKDGVWTEYDLPEGGCLALFKHPDPKAASEPGGASIAFEVESLEQLVAELKQKGIAIKNEHIESPVCLMTILNDTEGNTIILHKLKRDL